MKRLREEEEEEEEQEQAAPIAPSPTPSPMKRAREQVEDEEEHQQLQEQAAPMESSPTRNPGPAAAATTSGIAERRVIMKYDVVNFMQSVKNTFEQAKYYEFLDIIRQRDSIGVQGIADRMKVLLRGYPDLKHRFNMFLPMEYELSLEEDD